MAFLSGLRPRSTLGDLIADAAMRAGALSRDAQRPAPNEYDEAVARLLDQRVLGRHRDVPAARLATTRQDVREASRRASHGSGTVAVGHPGGSATNYRPTLGQRLGDAVYGIGRTMGYDNVGAGRMRDEATNIPVLGDLMTGLQGATDIAHGRYAAGAAGLGMAGIGLVPGVGDAAAAGLRQAERQGIRAFHVSPHAFDRFEISPNTARTGEGAQMIGYGGYFAESPGTRDYYYNQFLGRHEAGGEPRDIAAQLEHRMGREGAIEELQHRVDNLNHRRATAPHTVPSDMHNGRSGIEDALDMLRNGEHVLPSRYEVSINAHPDTLLDWDAPLADQTPHVRDAVATALHGTNLRLPLEPHYSGQTIYQSFLNGTPLPQGSPYANLGPRRAPQMLLDQGVPGIKYWDQLSRDASNGSRNYVIFDDRLIDIIRRYGLAGGAVGLGGLMAAQQQDGFN